MAAIAPSIGILGFKPRPFLSRAYRTSRKICGTMSISTSSFVIPMRAPKGPAQTRGQTMRVMVFMKATEDSKMDGAPRPSSRGIRRDGPVHRGAGQGRRLRWPPPASRTAPRPSASPSMAPAAPSSTGRSPRVANWSAGFSIWEVKDMDEAVAWAKRCPNPMPGRSEIEIRPFLEAADLAEFMTPEELAAPRDGERGKLGVA